jgi:hypothetical protein
MHICTGQGPEFSGASSGNSRAKKNIICFCWIHFAILACGTVGKRIPGESLGNGLAIPGGQMSRLLQRRYDDLSQRFFERFHYQWVIP